MKPLKLAVFSAIATVLAGACTAGFPEIEQHYQACLSRAAAQSSQHTREFETLRCDARREGAINRQLAAIDSVQIAPVSIQPIGPHTW